MLNFLQEAQYKENPMVEKTVIWIVLIAFGLLGLWRLMLFLESFWVEAIRRKPPFRHIYLFKRKLDRKSSHILKMEFSFYNKLSFREKLYFEHRVATFVKRHTFEGKSGLEIEERMRILIAATAVMLTFGYRDYFIGSVNHFIIYPKAYYSQINKTYHKGEFNLGLKTIVLSWEDFLNGYDISNDNFNLGIHEFVHAMHFDFGHQKNHSVNAVIFINTYNELQSFLDTNEAYKKQLTASKYLRDYAYTNQFEFVAVLIESFMETPQEFKSQFPEMYNYVKLMLNFNFAGY